MEKKELSTKKVKCVILGSSISVINIGDKTTGDVIELDPKKAEDYVKKKLVKYKVKREV